MYSIYKTDPAAKDVADNADSNNEYDADDDADMQMKTMMEKMAIIVKIMMNIFLTMKSRCFHPVVVIQIIQLINF